MKTLSVPGEYRVNEPRGRRSHTAIWMFALLMIAMAGPGFAQLTVTPITWDVVGLDHNRPETSGPELFPVGAEVCAVGGPSAGPITVDFIWTDGNGGADPYINSRPGSLTTLSFAALAADECIDAYFELQLTRSASAFENSREYSIEATDGTDTVTTPRPRQIYIEYLVSQNRNTTSLIRYGQQEDQSDWQTLGNGGSINLLIGETYYIELTTETATAYEELQSFLTLSNTIFQVLSVSTTYGVQTAPLSRVPDPNPQLWADGCLWESDPDSPNYLSCLADGKAGGQVVTTYEIRIISGGGDQVGLEALIYDRSGGSFHYNTDFSQSPGDLTTVDPAANAGFSKRFIPSTIGADGISTLRLTITNPNPVPVSGYSFTDSLPTDGTSQMEVAATPNVTNTCGGSVTAASGATSISFTGGALAANSSCTILVDVTVPDVVGATYPLALLNSVDLFVGAAATPSATATATLNVTAEPPPPQDCTDVTDATLAAWASFDNATTPTPTTDVTGTAAAQGGAGLNFAVSTNPPAWEARAPVTGQTLAAAIASNTYYEFRLDTTGIDSINFSLEAYRQNGGAPESLTLLYGPVGSLTQSTTLSPVPTQNNRPGINNFVANGLASPNLNPSGVTVFRVFAYGASNANQPVRILNVSIQGSGTVCTDIPTGDEPPPPTLAKTFSPDSMDVGATSTLTFNLTNNSGTDALTGVTFRDELPAGMNAVAGTFINSCNVGSTWGLEGGNSGILSFTGGTLAASASCTVSVQVRSTTVGANLNASDPIDAIETFSGNSATDTLTVLSPPSTPTIAKSFDPNPLLDPTGATNTTLAFEITNTDPLLDISGVAFADTLPTGMSFVTGTIVGDCGGGTTTISTTTDTNDTFTLANGAITADSSCTIEVDVAISAVDVSGAPVTFDNQSGLVSHVFNGITYTGNDAEATLVVDNPIPGVAILKEIALDPAGPWTGYLAVAPGDNVYYRITVENVGETTLTIDNVTDNTFDISSCSFPSSLPVADGANPTDHIAVCVTPAFTVQSDDTVVTNTATVNATGGTISVTDTDSATYAVPDLTLTKGASPASYTAAGQTITYTYTVANIAPSASLLGPVTVADNRATVTCPALTDDILGDGDDEDAYFEPGESIVCTATYTITAGDVTAGSVTNTATATVDGFDSPEDSVTVFVPVPPTIGKAFGSDPVAVGTTSDLTITVTNNAAIALSGVAYSDVLPAGLSFVSGTISGDCGSGTTGISTTTNTNDTFSLSGGAIAAAGSCAITVTVSADAVGSYTNTTSVVSSTEINGTTTGSDTLDVTIAGPTIGKSFADTLIGTGETTTLTITATNAAATALSNVAYTDQLPAGLSFVTGTISGNCGGGTAAISTTTNTNDTFSLSGGALAASGSCAITVDVSGDVEGSYTNTTSVVTSDEVDGTTTGSDDLDVEDLPTIGKSFDDATVETGETTTLTITVTNNAAATTLTGVSFSDQLPVTAAGELEYVAPVGGTCSALTGFAAVISDSTATSDLLSVSGFDLAAGASCTVTVDVQGNAEGDYTNETSAVSSIELTGTGTGTDDVEVGDLPTIAKSFATDPINVGGTSVLTITATNNAGFALSGVSFSDQLPVGLAYSGTATTDTCGGTTSINGGTRTLSVSGGAIAADSSCTIVIAVLGVAGGNFNNVTSVVDSTELTGTDTGSDTLTVNVPAAAIAIEKTQTSGPDPATAVGQMLGYTIVVTNTGAVNQTGVTVTDTLPDGTPGSLTGPTESGTANGILDVGETWTYTISYTVTQTNIDDGVDLVNTASVTTTEVPGPTTDTETTPVTPPIVRVSASKVSLPGDGTPVGTGDTITYALLLEVIDGPTTADTVLTDTLGSGLTFGSIIDNPGGFVAGGTGNNRTFTLPGGAGSGTFMVEYTAIVNPDATSSSVNNNLLVSGGGDPDPECTSCSTDHPLDTDITAIPTASTWGLLFMIFLLASAALLRLRSG